MTISSHFSSWTRAADPLVLPLAEATQEPLCGGKATGLARALELGLTVPEGIVVTNHAFQLFLEQDDLGIRIDRLVTSISGSDISDVRAVSNTIYEWVTHSRLPDAIYDLLQDIPEHDLQEQSLVVRSSGVGEDSGDASFAGQMDSFLDVRTSANIEFALKQCWASYWSERVLSYQIAAGKNLNGMGVLIQSQIDSKLAGVLFTESPIEEKSDGGPYMLGEFCYGQGISLVSGEINPGRFRIHKGDLSRQKLADPEQVDSPGASIDLASEWLESLAKAARKLEKYHHRPQDIEWAVDQLGNLFIVQSRPIVMQKDIAAECEMITWSNANVRENFPDPISPLLYSVASAGYSKYFRNLGLAFGISRKRIDSMEGALRNIVGVHGARIYYNLSSIHSVIRMAPFGDWLIKYFNSFVGAKETAPPRQGDQQFRNLDRHRSIQLLEMVRVVMKTGWQFMFLERRVERFESRVDQFSAETIPDILESKDITELRDSIRSFMDIRLNRWTDASLADVASMICYGVLNSLLKNTFPEKEYQALSSSLLKGVTGLVSSEPVFGLWKLSRLIMEDGELRQLFSEQPAEIILEEIRRPDSGGYRVRFLSVFNEYLEKWGYRCSGELMLTVPSFQEKPAGLIDIIKTYLEVEGESPEEVLQRQKADRKAQMQQMLDDIETSRRYGRLERFGRAFLIKRFLTWTHSAISMRERARLKQALLYSRLRRLALCMGQRFSEKQLLEKSDDIFFLSYQEIDELASSRSMFPYATRELIKQRRAEHTRLSMMVPPDSFVMEEGAYLNEADLAPEGDASGETDSEGVFEGATACGGKIQGRATVLHDVSESAQLSAGDILVTTQTDPGWAHVFFLIKGLVIERGGMLSHGAILAREFGIPAIVGVPEATARIPQHATVSLDADKGRIRVLE